MTLPGLVRANNLNDVVDRERAWDNLGSSLATGDISIPAPSLDLNFAANKSLVDDISGNNLITFSRASTGTFVGSNGLIQIAASGVPRFDHNPTTGESLGLLVEEARTNIIVSSQTFNSGGWTLDGASLTANAAAAPDATTTATSIVQGTGANRTFHFDNSGVTGSKVFSIFAKANAGTSLAIVSVGGMSPIATATVNLSNGTVSGFTGATVQSYPNGWYRVLLPVTVSIASGSSTYWQIFGPASSVFIWGAQLEAGAFPTSYISTTGATATRTEELVSILGSNFTSFYSPNKGTFFVQASVTGERSDTSLSTFVSLGTTANSHFAVFLTYDNRLNVGITVPTEGEVAQFYNLTGQSFKGATSFNDALTVNTASSSAINGTLYNANALNNYSVNGTPASFGGYDRLGIGRAIRSITTFNTINGTIARLTYWPSRLYNQALQYITQPSTNSFNLYAFNYAINGKDVLALNAAHNASTRNFIFIKGLLSAAQPRLTAAAATTSSALTLATNALPKLSPTSSGNYFFASGITLSGVTTRINGTNALSIATSPFSGSTATAPLLFRELRPQANWRFTEPMPSGTIASPELAIPFETNDFVLFMKAGQN